MSTNRIANRLAKYITVGERIRLAKLDYQFCIAVQIVFRDEHDPQHCQLLGVAGDAAIALRDCNVPYDEWDHDTDESCHGK